MRLLESNCAADAARLNSKMSWEESLFGGDELELWRLRLERVCDDFAHGAPAFATIEAAAMMGLNGLRATRTGFDSLADPSFIDTAADANDHANHLQHVRMIVKNDSQLTLLIVARNGWRRGEALGRMAT